MSHPVLRHRHHLLLLAAVFTMLVCIFSTGGSWAAVNDTNEPDLGDEVTPLPSKERMEENEKKCMSLYNHDKLMRAPPKPIDCRVVGESIADNPEHCTAFRFSRNGKSYPGLNPNTPCCYTGHTKTDKKGTRLIGRLPSALEGIVRLEDNEIIISLAATNNTNVLIPLIGPFPDRIEFRVQAFTKDCAQLCYEESTRDHWLAQIAQTTVTFSYSRTAGFDPLIRPDVPEHLNDLYGTRCPLCRNSFPVLNASVYDAKHKAKFVSGFDPEYTVYPTTNTITRKLKAMRTAKSINESMSGGACSNEEGFRPWRLDNGTTLGYYIPFRLLRQERVSGYNPGGNDESKLPFNATEGHYELANGNPCDIDIVFARSYQLLVMPPA